MPEPQPGCISQDTMRPRDLIPRFLEYLPDDDGRQAAERDYARLDWDADPNETCEDRRRSCCDEDATRVPFTCLCNGADEVLGELFDRLDSISPPGHFFGAHPGDGACYGWWPVEEEQE